MTNKQFIYLSSNLADSWSHLNWVLWKYQSERESEHREGIMKSVEKAMQNIYEIQKLLETIIK